MSVPLTRALRISRTEVMRAYLGKNAQFRQGYVWLSARDIRVCSVCWAMDGQEFRTWKPS